MLRSLLKKKYKATVHVGVFWKGPDLHLGNYCWLWFAKLDAWFYLQMHPYRAVTITDLNEI